jgi:hypothetical protein
MDSRQSYGGVLFYGPHAMSLTCEVFGCDAQTVLALRQKESLVALVRYRDLIVSVHMSDCRSSYGELFTPEDIIRVRFRFDKSTKRACRIFSIGCGQARPTGRRSSSRPYAILRHFVGPAVRTGRRRARDLNAATDALPQPTKRGDTMFSNAAIKAEADEHASVRSKRVPALPPFSGALQA